MKWIKVKDRPAEKGAILAFNAAYGEGHIHKAHCVGDDHILDDCLYANRLYKVTHWMPLPEPPEDL